MIRNIFIFIGTFVVGAVIALVARAAMFNEHAGHEGHPTAGGDYAPMVTNAPAPAKTSSEATSAGGTKRPAATKAAAPDPHAGHGAMTATDATSDKPVNTVCAICGMEVDPKLPTLEYQGKKIGFGCKICPPKFKADPDRYGPFYLRNEVIKK
jgi:hypothetical protein